MNHDGMPQPGDVIAGKFQVEEVLGAGGMGVVIAARHLVLRQRVAVKLLLPQALRLPDASARFVREARAAVAIQSEHVARVLDVGALDSGAPYMVMEFLAGTDMAKVLRRRGPLPIPEAIDFVLQAGEAIAEAHALGIVHRDLKPGNLFLTTRPEGSPLVKVLDFGLSKMTLPEDGAPEASLTATDLVMGSPHYMSPEQVRSLKRVDARTDVWALGVILYEMLCGRRPFPGASLTAVSASIVADQPPSVRGQRWDVPEALEAAIMGCLEKDPDRRTPTVAHLAQALAPFAPPSAWPSVERIVRLLSVGPALTASGAGLPRAEAASISGTRPSLVNAAPAASEMASAPSAAAAASVDAMVDAPTTVRASTWDRSQRISQRSRIAWIAAGSGVLLAAVIAIAWTRRTPAPSPSTPAAAPSAVASEPAAAAPIESTVPTATPPEVAPAPPPAASSAAPAPQPSAAPRQASAPPVAKTAAPKAPAKPRKGSVLDKPD
jgi:serine/threonine-protein kinase